MSDAHYVILGTVKGVQFYVYDKCRGGICSDCGGNTEYVIEGNLEAVNLGYADKSYCVPCFEKQVGTADGTWFRRI